MYAAFAKILIALGVLLVVIGLILLAFNKVGFLGNLPGDVHVRKENFEFHFPLASCIVVSFLFSLLLAVFFKWFKK